MKPAPVRKTKIVATVGPACGTENALVSLLSAGVDVFRINASHTTPPKLAGWIRRIRLASRKSRKPVPILVDLQGPRVRTGRLAGGTPVQVHAGESLTIEVGSRPGRPGLISTPVRRFPDMLSRGDAVLIDNGAVELKVLKKTSKRIVCRVVRGGLIGENKGINLPSAPPTLPSLTAKDKADLRVACRLRADFVGLSFVRSHRDVQAARAWIRRSGASIPVVAKIEKPAALADLSAVLREADGIMIARGDLGIEMGLEKVPAAQKMMIAAANAAQIPVITATQMLESMIDKSTPTRAEISDIANAVLDGTDAVMLSGETAVGRYPLEAVRVMARTIEEAEASTVTARGESPVLSEAHAIALAAFHAARDFHAAAIVVFTESGRTAELLSKMKPESRIVGITTRPETLRRLELLRGVTPLLWPGRTSFRSAEALIRASEKRMLSAGLLKKQDPFVLVSGRRFLPRVQFMTCVRRLGESSRAR